MRTNYCGLISEQYLDQTVTVKGWVHRRRDHGGVIFIDLRDREGIVQVVIDPDTPEAFAAADSARNEYVLCAGTLDDFFQGVFGQEFYDWRLQAAVFAVGEVAHIIYFDVC